MTRNLHQPLRHVWAGALVLLLALGLGGCDQGGASQNTIRVGEYGSLTGSEATFGQSTHKGILLAVEEQNAAGGVKGKKIELIHYDDQGKGDEVDRAVTRLITQDKVAALLGEVASSLSIAGGQVAQKYGVPMISPSSTNARVTQIGDMVYRVCFIDAFQGYVVAKFATENLKARKIAILYDQTQAYSKGLKEDFKNAFTKLGGTITTEQAYSGGDQDFSAQLTTIRDTQPDAIFVPGYYTDVGNIAKKARDLGIPKNVPLLGGDGWESDKLGQIAGESIEGSYYSNHYSREENRPELKDFIQRFKARNNGEEPDAMAALGYDAAKLLFDAMERAPALEAKALASAIGQTRGFKGVTGAITINKDRNADKSAVILQMKGGEPRYVATIAPPQTPATATAP